jgi:hypothetical protein
MRTVDDDRDERCSDLLHQFVDQGETGENNHGNFAVRQLGQLGGQAIIPTIREAVFDSDIAAFGIANIAKATANCS